MQRSVRVAALVCAVAACSLVAGTVLGNPWIMGVAICVSAAAGFAAVVAYLREP